MCLTTAFDESLFLFGFLLDTLHPTFCIFSGSIHQMFAEIFFREDDYRLRV